MTLEQKKEWLENATPDQLLESYVYFVRTNDFGRNWEDIKLVKEEIMKRMTK